MSTTDPKAAPEPTPALSAAAQAAEATHEINNALLQVTLGLELIERDLARLQAGATGQDWVRLRTCCSDALAGAERASALTRQLRTLLRPAEGRAAPPRVDALLPPASQSNRPRILLVDDEAHLGTALATGLRDRADVVAVRSGRDAVALLVRDDAFDLILCDVMLPDLEGMEVYAEATRARPALRDRFVFITGGAVTERAREFLDGMSQRRLDKPFHLEQVEALLAPGDP